MNKKYSKAELLEQWEHIHRATRELVRLWQSVAADGELQPVARRAIARLDLQNACTQKLATAALDRAN